MVLSVMVDGSKTMLAAVGDLLDVDDEDDDRCWTENADGEVMTKADDGNTMKRCARKAKREVVCLEDMIVELNVSFLRLKTIKWRNE